MHWNYHIFSRDPCEPSLVTVTGCGVDPRNTFSMFIHGLLPISLGWRFMSYRVLLTPFGSWNKTLNFTMPRSRPFAKWVTNRCSCAIYRTLFPSCRFGFLQPSHATSGPWVPAGAGGRRSSRTPSLLGCMMQGQRDEHCSAMDVPGPAP